MKHKHLTIEETCRIANDVANMQSVNRVDMLISAGALAIRDHYEVTLKALFLEMFLEADAWFDGEGRWRSAGLRPGEISRIAIKYGFDPPSCERDWKGA
jgi:hypothetical protein